jgi:hypothetical protein
MKYVFVAFLTYFAAIVVHIIVGFVDEKVIPALGLNESGTAVTAIDSIITAIGTAITAIVGIVTVITGLLTLNVVLKAFGIKLNFNMGMGGGRV